MFRTGDGIMADSESKESHHFLGVDLLVLWTMLHPT